METEENSYIQQKRKVLIVLGIAQLLASVAILLLGRFEVAASVLSILSAVGWAVGILSWVKIDAEEREAEVSGAFRIAIILLGFFALFYYLFRTRGFVGGLKGIGWALLYFVAFAAAYLIIGVILITILALAGMQV